MNESKQVMKMTKHFSGLWMVFMLVTPIQAQFAGGSGTEADPYQVETLEQLQAISHLTVRP